MDALFMEHDWYWSQGKGRQGDIVLLVNLVNLPFNPKRWEQPAPNISKAIRYRELVFMFIGWHAILENE